MPTLFGAHASMADGENLYHSIIKPRTPSPKKALGERSLSDLNIDNNARPTVRLVTSDSRSSEANFKSPLPLHVRKSSTDKIEKRLKPKDSVWTDLPTASVGRPVSRDGRPVTRDGPGVGTSLWVMPNIIKPPHRYSISTTTSNADTLVADSVLSPTSNRFSLDSAYKSPIQANFEGLPESMAPLAPVVELETDLPNLPSTEDLPDMTELPSSVAHDSRRLAHSSSVYSNSPFADLEGSDSLHSGLGFHIISRAADGGIGKEYKLRDQASMLSLTSTSSTTAGHSTPHLIKYQSSMESIEPQYASIRAPYHSQSISSLLSTASMNIDNLGQLQIPRKRARARAGSLNSHPSSACLKPSHLSTVASEFDAPEDSDIIVTKSPPIDYGTWPRRRRPTGASSTYSTSISSPQLERAVATPESYDSQSTGLHSESAFPEPLFSSSAPIPQRPFAQSSGQITDEMGDTIGELQAPPLREKRSGYFVRKRSQTELRLNPKQSMQSLSGESDRWSTGTFIFPQWATFFYSGRAAIPPVSTAESRMTLGGPAYGQQARYTIAGPPYAMMNQSMQSLDIYRPGTRGSHHRNETAASIPTRPGSAMSGWETINSVSPAASRFLGEIFKPLTRRRSQTDPETHSRNRESVSAFSISRQDPSMDYGHVSDCETELEHEPLPIPLRISKTIRNSFMPSGSKSEVEKQNDRLSQLRGPRAIPLPPPIPVSQPPPARTLRSYTSFPHLVPNRRLIQSISAWRVPSIDEPFPADLWGKGNRQIVCFCLGFLFPPLWILAAFLSLPKCAWRQNSNGDDIWTPPEVNVGNEKSEADRIRLEAQEKWTWDEERRFLKARWWRNLNRIMSVIGVGILAAIITLAVLASGA